MNPVINKKAVFIDLGLIDFKKGWDYQTSLFEKTLAIKKENRNLQSPQSPTENFLLFCEHPHVYTLGKSGKEHNLLLSVEELASVQAAFYHINRGGDITYHGPGQIVGYPIVDLENFFTDIHKYMRLLEEAVIQTVKEFDVVAGRIPGLTGVWVDPENESISRKICALGVKTSRWVTMHGFALNVNPDLSYFSHIVPCGINDKAVTSLQNEVGHPVDMTAVKDILKSKIAGLFEMNLIG
ncbi:MAG: lipoyl(octanoyl) transferase LipB [Cyclobacteriaceae bacterium]|nr:lipoyl(octanoyl) transferase LipB [Cyclobacteriaceae bacterium]MDH4296737.1 lipoyl(octanoyl) transferase LipB [Cyclobacteriaceae bacterium]MDH5247816.1 lipoyl(octanoyl) transferase LipB [Cyclobacteriaceae bacterium]